MNFGRHQFAASLDMDKMAEPVASAWRHVLRGMPLPWRVLDSNLQGVLDMEVREDDVFIVSYPKSGTNWLRAIVNYMLDCPEEQNNLSLPIELSMCSGTSPQEIEAAPPVFKIVQSWGSPRVMFTHLLPHLLPSQLFEKHAKIVYICRNPKDVSVSYSHFRKTIRTKETPPSLEESTRQFIQGEVPYGSYFTHVKQYWEMRERSNFLFIKYEDLKKDEQAVIREIGTFLGLQLDAPKLLDIAAQCSVQDMRRKFKMTSQAMSVILDESKGDFVRQGKVGSWKDTLTEAQSQHFDWLVHEHLGGTGLRLDFE